jgi:hypothetical protein
LEIFESEEIKSYAVSLLINDDRGDGGGRVRDCDGRAHHRDDFRDAFIDITQNLIRDIGNIIKCHYYVNTLRDVHHVPHVRRSRDRDFRGHNKADIVLRKRIVIQFNFAQTLK